MENMEMNEIITNNTVEEATEAVTSGKNGIKAGLIVGCSMISGAMLWEGVVKPIGRAVCTKIAQKIAQKKALKAKKAKEEVDLEDMEIEDIPEVE